MLFPRENGTGKRGMFQDLSEEEFKMHSARNRYGSFQLTDAIRPSLTLVPAEGYRIDESEDGSHLPFVLISASREKLLPLFMDLLDTVLVAQEKNEIVLEERRSMTSGDPTRISYGDITDLCVFKSIAYEYEDVLHDDGGMAIGVMNDDEEDESNEVFLDDHKTIIVCAKRFMADIENVLRGYDIRRKKTMKFIQEDEHVHFCGDDVRERCEELRMILGLSEEGDEEELWL